jgi:hypothetical protein
VEVLIGFSANECNGPDYIVLKSWLGLPDYGRLTYDVRVKGYELKLLSFTVLFAD